MILKRFLPILIVGIFLIACKKTSSSNNSIDVSAQWHFDISGNILSGYPDSQWRSVTFTAKELALFQSLDTVDLAGTTTPASISVAFYPNPFYTQFRSAVVYPHQYTGTCIIKYVIVDNLMTPIFKSFLVTNAASPGISLFAILPLIPVGQYRLYYTASAQGNENFYEGWGNIQKTN